MGAPDSDLWLMISDPPVIHSLMSGIQRAGIHASGVLKAQYTDGTEREIQCPEFILDLDSSEFTLLTVASAFSRQSTSFGGDVERKQCR